MHVRSATRLALSVIGSVTQPVMGGFGTRTPQVNPGAALLVLIGHAGLHGFGALLMLKQGWSTLAPIARTRTHSPCGGPDGSIPVHQFDKGGFCGCRGG